MKLRTGDTVIVTAGREKGKQGQIKAVIPAQNRVIVDGVNLYTRHLKPQLGQAGQSLTRERSLPTASVAIINDKGQPDRVGYSVAKDGSKTRIFKKTGKPVPEPKKTDSEKK